MTRHCSTIFVLMTSALHVACAAPVEEEHVFHPIPPVASPDARVAVTALADARRGSLLHVTGYEEVPVTYQTFEFREKETVVTTHHEIALNEKTIPVCDLPCAASVPPGTYRIGGKGIVGTGEFPITGSGPVELRVHTGSNTGAIFGLMVFSVGVVTLASGGVAVGHSWLTPLSADYSTQDRSGERLGGSIAMGAGAAAVVLGVLLIVPALTSVSDGAGRKVAGLPTAVEF